MEYPREIEIINNIDVLSRWFEVLCKIENLEIFAPMSILNSLSKKHKVSIDKSNDSLDLFGKRIIEGICDPKFNSEPNILFYVQYWFANTIENDIYVYFKLGNIAYLDDDGGAYGSIFESIGIEEYKDVTWQDAYRYLCELNNYENSFPEVPEV